MSTPILTWAQAQNVSVGDLFSLLLPLLMLCLARYYLFFKSRAQNRHLLESEEDEPQVGENEGNLAAAFEGMNDKAVVVAPTDSQTQADDFADRCDSDCEGLVDPDSDVEGGEVTHIDATVENDPLDSPAVDSSSPSPSPNALAEEAAPPASVSPVAAVTPSEGPPKRTEVKKSCSPDEMLVYCDGELRPAIRGEPMPRQGRRGRRRRDSSSSSLASEADSAEESATLPVEDETKNQVLSQLERTVDAAVFGGERTKKVKTGKSKKSSHRFWNSATAPLDSASKSDLRPQKTLSELSLQGRIWKSIHKHKKLGITVMSYNTLADAFKGGHGHGAYLNWNYRSPIILKELETANADLVALQEIDRFNTFCNRMLKLNYGCVYHPRKEVEDGLAMFYKADKFKLIERTDVSFNQADKYSQTHNVATLLELEVRDYTSHRNDGTQQSFAPGTRLVFASTHIYWDPSMKDLKLRQSFMLIDAINDFVKGDKTIPIIICGDFNSMPQSAVYQLFNRGKVGKSKILHSDVAISVNRRMKDIKIPPFASAYTHLSEPMTNYAARFKGCLDYIWLSPHFKVGGLLKPPSSKCTFPNRSIPSDHIPIMCEVIKNRDYILAGGEAEEPVEETNENNNEEADDAPGEDDDEKGSVVGDEQP